MQDEKTTQTEAKCPFHHANGVGTSNRDWWSEQLNLGILHQHSSLSNPMELSFSQQLGEYLERVQSSQYKTTVGELAKGDRAKITVAYFDGDRYGITHPNASERELKKAIEKYYIQKERRWGEWHLDSSGQPERGELNPVLRDHVSFAFLAGHEGSVSRWSKEAGPAIDIESEVLPTPTPPRPGENGKSQLRLLNRYVA